MKIDNEARKCVVFLGRGGVQSGDDFQADATGFFIMYNDCPYLVTARHFADTYGTDPFSIRVNTKDGGSNILLFDRFSDPDDIWWTHSDPSVDIAVALFRWDLQGGIMDQLAVSEAVWLDGSNWTVEKIGTGDTCYAIGLFQLMQGKRRNLPIVHTGSIAALPSDELIPIRDRNNKLTQVSGYLVEMTNLSGLSGSPVFVRSSIPVASDRIEILDGTPRLTGSAAFISAPSIDVSLLGVWVGSWDARPSDVHGANSPHGVRVPVGLGTVIPAQRILEILEDDGLSKHREGLTGVWVLGPDDTNDDEPSSN